LCGGGTLREHCIAVGGVRRALGFNIVTSKEGGGSLEKIWERGGGGSSKSEEVWLPDPGNRALKIKPTVTVH